MNARFVTFTWNTAASNYYAHPVVMMGNPSAIAPGAGDAVSHQERLMTMQVQIGSKMTPETECSSMGEFFGNLQQALDTYDQSLRTIAITPGMYHGSSFVAGFNLCRVPGGFASGVNTRTGDLLVIRCKNLLPGLLNLRVYVNILYEGVMEIRESGTSFYD